MGTTLAAVMKKLEAKGNAKMRTHNLKAGAGENQFGVLKGDIRAIAKTIKTDHALALELWKTGNADAQFLAVLILDAKRLGPADFKWIVRSSAFVEVTDWLHSYVLKAHPDREPLRIEWMRSEHPMESRAGWALTASRVATDPAGLDLPGLLDRIEHEMGNASPVVQWTMNSTLATIGIENPKLRKRAVSIGETLGIYRDYPCSKGCTSPFAPIWIAEMVKRKG